MQRWPRWKPAYVNMLCLPRWRGQCRCGFFPQPIPRSIFGEYCRIYWTLLTLTMSWRFFYWGFVLWRQITDGEVVLSVENGHPMLQKVSATGCLVTALIAAFLSVTPGSPLLATSYAMAIFGWDGPFISRLKFYCLAYFIAVLMPCQCGASQVFLKLSK